MTKYLYRNKLVAKSVVSFVASISHFQSLQRITLKVGQTALFVARFAGWADLCWILPLVLIAPCLFSGIYLDWKWKCFTQSTTYSKLSTQFFNSHLLKSVSLKKERQKQEIVEACNWLVSMCRENKYRFIQLIYTCALVYF